MSDSPRRVGVVVGMFVTVGLGLLSGGILAIGDLNETFTRKITVTAVFDEVNGLQTGDSIWFSGVKVGRVHDMRFEGESRVEVVMKVDRDAAEYIHEDTLAKIGSDGPIGSKLVLLYDGTPGAPHLEDGDVLRIGDSASVEDMMETFRQTNDNLLVVTNDLKALTAGLVAGEGTAGRLLTDEAMALQVSETVASLNASASQAKEVTANLSELTGNLNRPGHLAYDLANDETLYPQLQATAGQIQQTASNAATLVDGIATSAADPQTPVGLLLTDGEAAADVKETLANLNDGSRLLEEDLDAVQHHWLLRGAFKKRSEARAVAAGSASGAPSRPSDASHPSGRRSKE